MDKEKLYTSKELNDILGYKDESGSNNGKNQVLTRCNNAGLKIELAFSQKGKQNLYRILENNFLLDDEIWVQCYCYKDWEVSSLGRVRRKSTKKLLGQKGEDGYVCITGKGNDGKTKRYIVHRLIYFSFNPDLINNANQFVVDHINGKRDDNRLDNLRILTNQLNTRARDENQNQLQSILTKLILKYGYDELEQKLLKML